MNQKNVLAVCSCGIATSSVVVIKIKEISEKFGIDLKVDKCMVGEYPAKLKERNFDLVISTTQVTDLGVPIINAIGFLTGIGVEALEQNIIQHLKSNEA